MATITSTGSVGLDEIQSKLQASSLSDAATALNLSGSMTGLKGKGTFIQSNIDLYSATSDGTTAFLTLLLDRAGNLKIADQNGTQIESTQWMNNAKSSTVGDEWEARVIRTGGSSDWSSDSGGLWVRLNTQRFWKLEQSTDGSKTIAYDVFLRRYGSSVTTTNAAESGLNRSFSISYTSPETVTLTNHDFQDLTTSSTATAGVMFRSDGRLQGLVGANYNTQTGEWLTPTGDGSAYRVRASLTADLAPSSGPALDTWHPLTSDVEWRNDQSTAGFARTSTLFCEIDKGDGNVLASATITIMAEYTDFQ